MKLICRTAFYVGLLSTVLIFTGCASQKESFFSDVPDNGPAVSADASSGNVAAPMSQTAPSVSEPSASSTQAAAALPPSVAVFHVGDTVNVSFSGLPTALDPHSEPIKEDGTIELPDIGKVQAAGKTAGELQNDIHDLYVPSLYRHLTVNVSTGDRVYYVRGEVKGPGRQLYVGQTTVTRAIASAGDFTDFANHKNVALVRANGEKITVNCDRILDGKDTDPPVYPGDQIVVKLRWW